MRPTCGICGMELPFEIEQQSKWSELVMLTIPVDACWYFCESCTHRIIDLSEKFRGASDTYKQHLLEFLLKGR